METHNYGRIGFVTTVRTKIRRTISLSVKASR